MKMAGDPLTGRTTRDRDVYDRERGRAPMDLFGRSEDDADDGEDGEPRVALFVDGPNVLREEFDVDLDDVREAASEAGRPAATRLYVDEHATPQLIQAAEARGFEVIVTSGDVDVKLAVDLTRFAVSGRADVIAITSRDVDFKPAIEAANAAGLRTLAIAPGTHGRSDGLRNAAGESVTLGESRE
jgi:uncharacterized protein (TIGR00288 family)